MVDAAHILLLAVVAGGLSVQTPSREADLFLLLRPGAAEGAALGLVLEGAPLDLRDARMATPLHHAAAFAEDPELIRAMLARGADPGAVDAQGRTPLHEAAARLGGAEVAEALVAGGAPLDAADARGRTPLHGARDPQVAALLVLAGADPCLRDGRGEPALPATALPAIGAATDELVGALVREAWLSCLD